MRIEDIVEEERGEVGGEEREMEVKLSEPLETYLYRLEEYPLAERSLDPEITLLQYLLGIAADIEERSLENLGGDLTLVTPEFPLEVITFVFGHATNMCLQVGWSEGAQTCLETWLSETESNKLLVLALNEGFFDDEAVLALIKMWRDRINLASIIETIITDKDFGPTMEISSVLERLWRLMTVKPTLDQLNTLIGLAEKKMIDNVFNFLLMVKPELSPLAEVPEYIVAKPPLSTNQELIKQVKAQKLDRPVIRNKSELITYILKTVPSDEVIEKALTNKFNSMTEHEVEHEIKEFTRNLWQAQVEENVLAIQVLGPRNSDPNQKPGKPSKSDILSYRMFTDSTRDYDLQTGEYDPWFLGYCQMCYQRIEKPCYAVRLPMPSGGWTGCFCTFEHIHSWLTKSTLYEKEFEDRLHELTGYAESIILTHGILDRTYLTTKEKELKEKVKAEVERDSKGKSEEGEEVTAKDEAVQEKNIALLDRDIATLEDTAHSMEHMEG